MDVKVDALGDVSLLWLHEHSLELCNCSAKDHGGVAEHWWTCSSTPIFARMGPGLVSNALNVIAAANLAITQTVIKCAECGQERLGKDLLVIYQAQLDGSSILPGYSFDMYKYPHNIVKAVCPEHNRNGSANYQRIPPTGVGSW